MASFKWLLVTTSGKLISYFFNFRLLLDCILCCLMVAAMATCSMCWTISAGQGPYNPSLITVCVFALTIRPCHLPTATVPSPIRIGGICAGCYLFGAIVVRLSFVANTGIPMARAPNGLVMAVVVALAALFCQGTLKYGGSFSGTGGVVELLDLNISTLNVVTPIVQEAEIVVLQV